MLTPDKFEINKTWIAVRLNPAPLILAEGACNMYGLMDAGSCYLFGGFPALASETADKNDVENLFNQAFLAKNEWAEKLLITERSDVFDIFESTAEEKGLVVEYVSLKDVMPIVGEAREHLMESFG